MYKKQHIYSFFWQFCLQFRPRVGRIHLILRLWHDDFGSGNGREEHIPETAQGIHTYLSTIGFVLMMVMDVMLGVIRNEHLDAAVNSFSHTIVMDGLWPIYC